MNKQEQRAVKRYLHDIKRTLPVYRKMERRFLSDIHSTICLLYTSDAADEL